VRGIDRYKEWVRLIRTGDPDNICAAVAGLEARQEQFGLSGGEELMLQRARELLAEGADEVDP
jgi:RNA polymerase-interacting CarD/CdnL/TRCF family regulator